jgi:hypothetical protein
MDKSISFCNLYGISTEYDQEMNDISGKKIKPLKDNSVSKGSSAQHAGYSNTTYPTQPYRFHSYQILCKI